MTKIRIEAEVSEEVAEIIWALVDGEGEQPMTRDEAIEIARECAKAKPQSYYAEPFQPHEWVIDAIIEASRRKAVTP